MLAPSLPFFLEHSTARCQALHRKPESQEAVVSSLLWSASRRPTDIHTGLKHCSRQVLTCLSLFLQLPLAVIIWPCLRSRLVFTKPSPTMTEASIIRTKIYTKINAPPLLHYLRPPLYSVRAILNPVVFSAGETFTSFSDSKYILYIIDERTVKVLFNCGSRNRSAWFSQ